MMNDSQTLTPTLANAVSEVLPNAKETQGASRQQVIVFKLGQEEYALPIEQIKEVVLTPPISRIPQTAAYVKGVANIRGNIIAILDLEQRFDLVQDRAGETSGSAHYTLVIENATYRIGILSKEVPNTLTVTTADIDTSANILQYSSLGEQCIQGIVKAGDRMIMLLDVLKMMEGEEQLTVARKAKGTGSGQDQP